LFRDVERRIVCVVSLMFSWMDDDLSKLGWRWWAAGHGREPGSGAWTTRPKQHRGVLASWINIVCNFYFHSPLSV
jgi:hypothetical protein